MAVQGRLRLTLSRQVTASRGTTQDYIVQISKCIRVSRRPSGPFIGMRRRSLSTSGPAVKASTTAGQARAALLQEAPIGYHCVQVASARRKKTRLQVHE